MSHKLVKWSLALVAAVIVVLTARVLFAWSRVSLLFLPTPAPSVAAEATEITELVDAFAAFKGISDYRITYYSQLPSFDADLADSTWKQSFLPTVQKFFQALGHEVVPDYHPFEYPPGQVEALEIAAKRGVYAGLFGSTIQLYPVLLTSDYAAAALWYEGMLQFIYWRRFAGTWSVERFQLLAIA